MNAVSPRHTLRARRRRRRRRYNIRHVNPFRVSLGGGWVPCGSCGQMSNGEHRRECKGPVPDDYARLWHAQNPGAPRMYEEAWRRPRHVSSIGPTGAGKVPAASLWIVRNPRQP